MVTTIVYLPLAFVRSGNVGLSGDATGIGIGGAKWSRTSGASGASAYDLLMNTVIVSAYDLLMNTVIVSAYDLLMNTVIVSAYYDNYRRFGFLLRCRVRS